MRDRFVLNLVLGTAMIALATIAYWRPGQKDPEELPRISERRADAVRQIDLRRRAQTSVTFARDTNEWRVLAPTESPANETKVAALLNILATRSTATLPGDDLESFELADPRVTLRFDEDLWSFGASHPLDGRRYVLHNGTVHLVDDRFFHHLIAAPHIYMAEKPAAETGPQPPAPGLAR